jgi:hypothetical protein
MTFWTYRSKDLVSRIQIFFYPRKPCDVFNIFECLPRNHLLCYYKNCLTTQRFDKELLCRLLCRPHPSLFRTCSACPPIVFARLDIWLQYSLAWVLIQVQSCRHFLKHLVPYCIRLVPDVVRYHSLPVFVGHMLLVSILLHLVPNTLGKEREGQRFSSLVLPPSKGIRRTHIPRRTLTITIEQQNLGYIVLCN